MPTVFNADRAQPIALRSFRKMYTDQKAQKYRSKKNKKALQFWDLLFITRILSYLYFSQKYLPRKMKSRLVIIEFAGSY